MKDKKFLIWMYRRLLQVHDESPSFDYMQKLKSIIGSTDPDVITPNTNPDVKGIDYD